ncbi:addiction module protein [Candidatus Thiosymbion oneisti]|uniref:addiction module protein n=1 Tax=Candidatus Thiosymbion oneisti TaxID=589554 RepID=UPI000B800ABD|nr:addiction module protein [Candidatus Thiosymbion oneisti]
MVRTLAEIEQAILRLNQKERAALARNIIDDLDTVLDENVDRLWLEEAQQRYQAYIAGETKAKPAQEVFDKARRRLRQ